MILNIDFQLNREYMSSMDVNSIQSLSLHTNVLSIYLLKHPIGKVPKVDSKVDFPSVLCASLRVSTARPEGTLRSK